MRLFLKRLLFGIFLALCLSGANSWAKSPAPSALLLKVDYLLTPKGSYEYSGKISVERDGKVTEALDFWAAAQDLNLRRFLIEKPKSEKGKSLLGNNEMFWLYLPKIRKSVRVPPEFPFAGEISNADLGQPFFSLNYQAVLSREDEFEGLPVYVLTLLPRSKNSNYAKLKVWVAKEDLKPLRVEYFEIGGKLLKICRFENFQEELGAKLPLRWVYEDAARPDRRTILQMRDFERKNFALSIFDPQWFPDLDVAQGLKDSEEIMK